ncbi:hypothetical protein ACLOJK_024760 [Asimina triloba]
MPVSCKKIDRSTEDINFNPLTSLDGILPGKERGHDMVGWSYKEEIVRDLQSEKGD